MENNFKNDHDLLVTIHAKVERVIFDVQELKTNVAQRVTDLENTKVEKDEFVKLQEDVKWLQRIAYGGMGILSAIQFYFNAIK